MGNDEPAAVEPVTPERMRYVDIALKALGEHNAAAEIRALVAAYQAQGEELARKAESVDDLLDRCDKRMKRYRKAELEADTLREANRELREAIEAALRIETLWRPAPGMVYTADVAGELAALQQMHAKFLAALAPTERERGRSA